MSGTAHFSGQTRVDGKLLVGSPVLPVQGNHELYVNGSIIAEEIKVELQGNWPDYVFETSYPLMPLAEVEEFVQVHKHLPGVPSMSEIAQEGGFELGDMNRRLLEKVEELTLYLFEQQKQIDVLQKEINDLKK